MFRFDFFRVIFLVSVCYPPQPSASVDNTNLGLYNSRYYAQPHPILLIILSFDYNVILPYKGKRARKISKRITQ